MHEECCAHVHVDAVFCKCNSYLYYFGNFALTNFRKASPIGKRTNLQLGHLSLMETRMWWPDYWHPFFWGPQNGDTWRLKLGLQAHKEVAQWWQHSSWLPGSTTITLCVRMQRSWLVYWCLQCFENIYLTMQIEKEYTRIRTQHIWAQRKRKQRSRPRKEGTQTTSSTTDIQQPPIPQNNTTGNAIVTANAAVRH